VKGTRTIVERRSASALGRALTAAFEVCMTLVSLGVQGAATDNHPSPYTDAGACPFECCTYREWKVEHRTVLHAAPKGGAAAVGKVERGDSVMALTGEVVTVPARFRVKRDHGDHHAGDAFWVYTYIGEGFFKVWHDEKMEEEQLDFSPYAGGTGGERCEESERQCWGELDTRLKMTWWIKLRTSRGVEGWSREHENFSGSDACG
jgi:hypothetical protein